MDSAGRVLVIAGSDSGGGAGIQGDIKTITCLGGYAATAITALTAQNTRGVAGIHEVPPAFVAQQITLVLEDIGADAVKTGMLHSAEVIRAVADTLRGYMPLPLVVDPVMVAKGGAVLLESEAVEHLQTLLFPMTTLVTPNVPEAELLTGMRIRTVDDMRAAAERIRAQGAAAVLVKGGHLNEDSLIPNLLLAEGSEEIFTQPRIKTLHTHGTGCALASAIATGLAQGMELAASVRRGVDYVARAIVAAPGLGHGHGPLGHNFMIEE